jgi:hypothetical protein
MAGHIPAIDVSAPFVFVRRLLEIGAKKDERA